MASAINGHTTKIRTLRPLVVRTPQELQSLSRIRKKAEKAVDRLLAILDELGADPDLEDGGDDEADPNEPDLGWTATTRQEGPNWFGPTWVGQAFINYDCELDDADNEPSLGAPENHTGGVWHLPDGRYVHATQTRWARGGTGDREDDGDDLEPEHFL